MVYTVCMTVYFKEPEPDTPPSLSERIGLSGNIVFIGGHTWFAAEDNEPEYVTVHVAVKKREYVHYSESSDVDLDILKRIQIPRSRHIQVQFS